MVCVHRSFSFRAAFAIVITCALLVLLSACSSRPLDSDERPEGVAEAVSGIPVGFDRRAGFITFDSRASPSFQPVRTARGVLNFAGKSADGNRLAYTSIAKLDAKTKKLVQVDSETALDSDINELVPTGELVVEDGNGTVTTFARDGAYITSAAWHPTDPDTLGYSFSKPNGSGLVVVNVKTGKETDAMVGAITPDYIAWSEDGESVGAYMPDDTLPLEDVGHGVMQHMQRWQYADGRAREALGLEQARSLLQFSLADGRVDMSFRSGTHVSLRNAFGDPEAVFEVERDGRRSAQSFRADQVRFRSRDALAYVNYDKTGEMTLWATNGVAPPQLVTHALAAVSYYIPMHGLEAMSFTQLGSSYPGGGCRVSSHTGLLSYAVDMQISSGGDEVIASAAGTVASFASGVTCNRIDTDGCSAYSPMCSSQWGNWVIVSHADGRYTLYAHMEKTNYNVTHTGPISRGCWIGDEGNTGNTSGSKNGCGDHLHFQWMNVNSTSGQSISGSFQDASALGSGSCATQSPVTGAMSCVL
jgi:hypothetical protein